MSRLSLPSIPNELAEGRLSELFQNLLKWANGGLNPYSNFRQVVFTGTTPGVANTEFTLTHKLGIEMAGTGGPDDNGLEFVYWLDGAGTLYESDKANWDENSFKLKCTDANRAYTIIVR